ncbi:ATPase inhibitor mai-2, mitochondrial-like isoform X2 [Dermacentor albipictus]|uniref:ATPase inhibitor mai-2, mitochondrial-like isoform X2 n=1 Tax=Dermacentor albipictus TaxID=60249 RepID=UPI0038FC7B8A
MALQQGFRAAKNFKRLACRISPLRPKSSIPADWSGGAGKGGGAGGSIREAGGGFAKIQVAREEQYFRKLQEAQIKKLHDHITRDIKERESLIKELQSQIDKNKKILEDLKSRK